MALLVGAVPFAQRIHPHQDQCPDEINHVQVKTEIGQGFVLERLGGDNDMIEYTTVECE